MSTMSFNSAAASYDDEFTNSDIGKLQRNRVYHWLDKLNLHKKTKRIFEINCGTGYDAEAFLKKGHHVIATDVSEEMIKLAKRKRDATIRFYTLDFSEVATNEDFKKSSVLFSNFGGLNCLSNQALTKFLQEVTNQQEAEDFLILVIMGKHCFMENLYHLLKLQWTKIGRRNTVEALNVNVNGTGINTYYHSPDELLTILRPTYDIKVKKPIAFFIPPSYMEPFFKKHKTLLRFLNKLESIFGSIGRLSAWSDHYILIAEKK